MNNYIKKIKRIKINKRDSIQLKSKYWEFILKELYTIKRYKKTLKLKIIKYYNPELFENFKIANKAEKDIEFLLRK